MPGCWILWKIDNRKTNHRACKKIPQLKPYQMRRKSMYTPLYRVISDYTWWPVLLSIYILKDHLSYGVSARTTFLTLLIIKISKDHLGGSFEKVNATSWLGTGHGSKQAKCREKWPRIEGAITKLSHSGWQTARKVICSKRGWTRLSRLLKLCLFSVRSPSTQSKRESTH